MEKEMNQYSESLLSNYDGPEKPFSPTGQGKEKPQYGANQPGSPTSVHGSIWMDKEQTAVNEDVIQIHLLTPPEVFADYDTTMGGIQSDSVQKRRDRFGVNMYSPVKGLHPVLKYGGMYFNGFSIFFIVAAILCLSIFKTVTPPDQQTMWLGISLLLVVFLTGTFDCYQAYKATKALKFDTGDAKIYVVRDGNVINIPTGEVVVGDLVKLENGNRICADMRIVEASDLKLDFSALTGEPEALSRSVDSTDNNPMETSNLAFAGTFVVEGSGLAVCFAVGDKTVLGKIAASANNAKQPVSNMEKELNVFVRYMSLISFIIATIFVILGAAVQKLPIHALISIFIAGIIANVPEGLLPQLSAQLTLTATRMAARNVVVKNSKIIETIGIATVIASDKTGTLTMNRMTVSHLWFDQQLHVHGAMDDPKAVKFSEELQQKDNFTNIKRCLLLNNNAEFEDTDSSKDPEMRGVRGGNATDCGFLRFCQKLCQVTEMRRKYQRHFEIPFNSRTKTAVVVHTVDGKLVLYLKGAVERVLEKCSKIDIGGKHDALSQDYIKSVHETNKYLSSLGERVLAFAYLDVPFSDPSKLTGPDSNLTFPLENLTFAGLVSVIDPPRPEVPGAIEKCRTAGIQVIMVTGDHPLTATAISKQIGIVRGRTRQDVADERKIEARAVPYDDFDAVVIHGDEINDLVEEDWKRILSKKEIVFSRTLPEQKQQIVKHLQELGHKVVVTGDGTNDCPALKQADCGVAMGKNGTEIAKDSASIVLLDDNFASIVSGIEQGRLIFENMKKCVFYTLTHCVTEIFPFVMYLAFGFPLALETIMALCIDLGTELAPAIALAFEDAEGNIMQKPPRDLEKDKLQSRGMFIKTYGLFSITEAIICFGVFLFGLQNYGFSVSDVSGLGPFWHMDNDEMETKQRTDEQVRAIRDLAFKNKVYFEHLKAENLTHSWDAWRDFRGHALDSSKASFLWAVVLCQIANAIACSKSYNPFWVNMFGNFRLYVAFVISLILITIVTYTPGVKDVFTVERIQMKTVALGLIGFPIMMTMHEVIKFFNRRGKLMILAL